MNLNDLARVLRGTPRAIALFRGSQDYPNIRGTVRFYQTRHGVLVAAEVRGLPTQQGACSAPVFGFHIHSGGSCTGNENDPFANALTHYNPSDCPHPHHSGDLPPLFGNHGYAVQIALTDRFRVSEVIGKTIIIHANPDDFTTQPSGNSGVKIACGVITGNCRAQNFR